MISRTITEQEKFDLAAKIIERGKHVVVLSGAGTSTPSGIPDFRSENDGLWQKHDPWEVASLLSFRHSPESFYEWFQPLAERITQADPNPAHITLAQMETEGHIQAIITQNIDDLHRKAGSKQVHEVHGTVTTLTCVSCYRSYNVDDFLHSYVQHGEIPRCPDCAHVLKPDAILLGEQLPVKTFQKAEAHARKADVLLVVGSSLEVMPVAGLPMRSLENGANLIIINNTATYLDKRAEVVLRTDVAHALPAIQKGIRNV